MDVEPKEILSVDGSPDYDKSTLDENLKVLKPLEEGMKGSLGGAIDYIIKYLLTITKIEPTDWKEPEHAVRVEKVRTAIEAAGLDTEEGQLFIQDIIDVLK